MRKAATKKKSKKKSSVESLRPGKLSTFRPDSDALFVGVDLGTCRASISASNGIREVVPTYVGYPKDNISEELLGTEPLFGDTALKHRLSVDLIRPLAHGVIQDTGKGSKNRNL
ncbi:MAG: hypothetical protein ACYS17_16820, partial [Planctomycetota bacterium]